MATSGPTAASYVGPVQALPPEFRDILPTVPRHAAEVLHDPPLADEPGAGGALERMKSAEQHLHGLYVAAMRRGTDSMEIMQLQKTHNRALSDLVGAEMKVHKLREHAGQLVEFEPLARAWDQSTIALRNSLMGLPHIIVPLLRPDLRDPDESIARVVRIMTEEIRRVLEAFSEQPSAQS